MFEMVQTSEQEVCHEVKCKESVSRNSHEGHGRSGDGRGTVKVGNLEVVAAITDGSVKNMGLKVNDPVTVAVKATDVMVGK